MSVRHTYSLGSQPSRMYPQGCVSFSPPGVVMKPAGAPTFSGWQVAQLPGHGSSILPSTVEEVSCKSIEGVRVHVKLLLRLSARAGGSAAAKTSCLLTAASSVAAAFSSFTAASISRASTEMDLCESTAVGSKHLGRCRFGMSSSRTTLKLRAAHAWPVDARTSRAGKPPRIHALSNSGVGVERLHALSCPTTGPWPHTGRPERVCCIPAGASETSRAHRAARAIPGACKACCSGATAGATGGPAPGSTPLFSKPSSSGLSGEIAVSCVAGVHNT